MKHVDDTAIFTFVIALILMAGRIGELVSGEIQVLSICEAVVFFLCAELFIAQMKRRKNREKQGEEEREWERK